MAVDIQLKLESDFGDYANEAKQVLLGLDAKTKGLSSDRMFRSLLYLANGNLGDLKGLAELALIDYRDVFWQAEYDCGEVRLRDFSKSFHELGLL